MNELGFNLDPVDVYEDNQACLQLIEGQAITDRTRHIDVRAWWTRELKGLNMINFKYVKSKENIADFFTKIVGVDEQKQWIAKLTTSK